MTTVQCGLGSRPGTNRANGSAVSAHAAPHTSLPTVSAVFSYHQARIYGSPRGPNDDEPPRIRREPRT